MSGRPEWGQALSAGELETLEWMAHGSTYKQVARRRGVTTEAAESTGHRILVKLGADSMAHAVYLGICLELIEFPTPRQLRTMRIMYRRRMKKIKIRGQGAGRVRSRDGAGSEDL